LLWRGALRAGDAAQLVVGVRTAPAFRAHAWVELPDGRVLGGAPAALTPLAVWGPAGELRPGSASARHAGQRP
ncbi:MAG TPA: lasso peptide biosynthesis B2 protein, partial [Pilimelia sp.]|nr:lasso peptide biosynthesis B2 protein [Pilimelia sp.]